MREMIQRVAIYLDAVANLIAGLAMIAAILAIFAGIIQLAFLPQDPEQTRAARALEILHSNWRGLVIVVVPLFYPAIRRFLEEVDQVSWIKRGPREGFSAESDELEDNSDASGKKGGLRQ